MACSCYTQRRRNILRGDRVKIIVIKSRQRLRVEDLRKLHMELTDQLPTRILLLPAECDYEVIDLDISNNSDLVALQRVIRIENK